MTIFPIYDIVNYIDNISLHYLKTPELVRGIASVSARISSKDEQVRVRKARVISYSSGAMSRLPMTISMRIAVPT